MVTVLKLTISIQQRMEGTVVMVFLVTWCFFETACSYMVKAHHSTKIPETCTTTNQYLNSCPVYQPSHGDTCPNGFSQLSNSNNLCYTIRRNQRFPPKCDYPSALPFDEVECYLRRFHNYQFWVNVHRNSKNGFGQLQWVERGPDYGTVLSSKDLVNPNADEDCVIYANSTLKRVSCSEFYDTICFYSMYFIQATDITTACTQNYDYSQCIVSHYDLKNPTCFCKKLNEGRPFKKSFCSKIAEPIFPYQSKFIQKFFSSDPKQCWIGFYKDNGNFKWNSTHTNVSYTSWAKPNRCDKNEGAYVFDHPQVGWFLTDDRTLDCALCEVEIVLPNSSLTLEYVPSKNNILLTVDNHVSVSKVFKIDVHCFSDANEDDIKTKISFQVTKVTQNQLLIEIDILNNRPSHYWCNGFQYNTDKPLVSNTIVAYDHTVGYGNEYVLFVGADDCKGSDPFINKCYLKIPGTIKARLQKSCPWVDAVRPVRGNSSRPHEPIFLIIHITTKHSSNTVPYEFDELKRKLNAMASHYMRIYKFFSGEFCLPDTTLTGDNDALQWPLTRIGMVAIPENKLCMDEKQNMLPVTRKCGGSFLHGAEWEKVIGDCRNSTIYPETTTELFKLFQLNSSTETSVKLEHITSDHKNKSEMDVYLVSSVLRKLVDDIRNELNSSVFVEVVSNVMNFDEVILRNSQRLLNSTDEILFTLDHFIDLKTSCSLKLQNLVVQVSEYRDNVIGAALCKRENSNGFDGYTLELLYNTTNINDTLMDDRTEIIIFLPKDLSLKNPVFSIKIFYNDNLFNEGLGNGAVTGKIVSVSINDVLKTDSASATIAFKIQGDYKTKNCSFWKYGIDSQLMSVYGTWITDNGSLSLSKFEACKFNHLTHFALLLQGPQTTGQRNLPMEILIAVGSALSLIGVIPIFLSAIAFKSWRIRTGNIILVNVCLSITFETILTFLLYTVRENEVFCTIIGAALHYTDLVEFFWMLIVAYLQYRRFVTVFNHEKNMLLRRCLILGWIVPFIPVMVILIINSSSYRINLYGYCYVTGYYFIFGSLVPILLILCINAVIFVVIMFNIRKQKSTEYRHDKNTKLEILLAIFLFFALGLTWIFGIAGALGGGIWFTYLFCAMTSVRGLVLFLFLVLGNNELKMLWQKRYHYYVKNKLQDTSKRYPTSVMSNND